jgi:hypothetical protein
MFWTRENTLPGNNWIRPQNRAAEQPSMSRMTARRPLLLLLLLWVVLLGGLEAPAVGETCCPPPVAAAAAAIVHVVPQELPALLRC